MENSVDQYISQFPDHVQEILQTIRKLILNEVPDAHEKISYAIPGYYYEKKPMIYFAAFKNHIGFYATPEIHEELEEKLKIYKQGKGSVQFPLKNDIPYDLIKEMVKLKKQQIIQSQP